MNKFNLGAKIKDALESGDYDLAGKLSRVSVFAKRHLKSELILPDDTLITQTSIRHMFQQLDFLTDRNLIDKRFDKFRDQCASAYKYLYENKIQRMKLSDFPAKLDKSLYNRLIYFHDDDDIINPLSPHLEFSNIVDEYKSSKIGLVVVDNFLSAPALKDLQDFCNRSTIWYGNRYGYGRLGAQFADGFCSKTLTRIAQDVRANLAPVIEKRFTLKRIWGFKSGPKIPADKTYHADAAAINVNLWITPDSSNLSYGKGGLVIYHSEAPSDWSFHDYNGNQSKIIDFLSTGIDKTVVEYKCNRAIIFNSDLFHSIDEVNFKDSFEDRRINITFLFGDRVQEKTFFHDGKS